MLSSVPADESRAKSPVIIPRALQESYRV